LLFLEEIESVGSQILASNNNFDIRILFVLFTSGMLFESADKVYGQTESPFANCIMIIDKTLQMLLSTDEDCDEQQFSEALSYYKANGLPMKALTMVYSDQSKRIYLLITVIRLKVR
jgi:hypothetical protein